MTSVIFALSISHRLPSIPRAADLRPFPTSRAVQYETPTREGQEQPPMIRCLAVSPDGQFLASGASDGFVRLWEVQTSRLLRSWDVSSIIANGDVATNANGENESTSKSAEPIPVVAVEWNPNRSHHVLLVAIGKCAVIIATGTGGADHAEMTEALLSAAISCKDGGSVKNAKAAKAVSWVPLGVKKLNTLDSLSMTPISAFGGRAGPICLLRTNKDANYIPRIPYKRE